MKPFCLLLSAGLASALSLANPFARNGAVQSDLISNSSAIANNSSDIANGTLNLGGNLNLNGLDLNNLNFSNQNDVARAILALLSGLCLGNVLDLNGILALGLSGDLELFQELVQLVQLQQLGFLNNGGASALFNSGLSGGNFNIGLFKREVAEAKKSMKRTRLRRSSKSKANTQCNAASGNQAAAAAAAAAPEQASAAPEAVDSTSAAESDAGENLSDFTR
ncbi:hypothetical protein B0T22DRAFT_158751 [Podospora appendiculata]|uniref:Uncharacterized protein n=1 Tax=Podospora appendiculata TaxID=314037 RepID=A0AAE0X9K5_9PEZI|nr:hypothetical protein B0T22DRAFT_158751 [Podospora appendiculata]